MLRRTPLRLVPPPDHSDEPGYREWHSPIFGNCAVCGERGRLVRHHVVLEQHCRTLHADPWDLRNAIKLGMHCRCHRAHHDAAGRIPISKLTPESIEFCVELFGAEVADLYLDRYYAPL